MTTAAEYAQAIYALALAFTGLAAFIAGFFFGHKL